MASFDRPKEHKKQGGRSDEFEYPGHRLISVLKVDKCRIRSCFHECQRHQGPVGKRLEEAKLLPFAVRREVLNDDRKRIRDSERSVNLRRVCYRAFVEETREVGRCVREVWQLKKYPEQRNDQKDGRSS